jgi:hypothetical protein
MKKHLRDILTTDTIACVILIVGWVVIACGMV